MFRIRSAVCLLSLAALAALAGLAPSVARCGPDEVRGQGGGRPAQAAETPATSGAPFRAAFEKVAPAVLRVSGGRGYSSGLLLSDDGLLVTHRAIVEKTNEATILFPDGKTRQAKVLVRDDKTKLAILQLLPKKADEKTKDAAGGAPAPKDVKTPETPDKRPTVTLGSSARLALGSWVATIAYPHGADVKARTQPTLSADILVGRGTLGEKADYNGEVLLTDAAMNAGSEGGALVTPDGLVVGVLLGPQQHQATGTVVNAALPVEVLAPLVKRARENPDPPLKEEAKPTPAHGFLGVRQDPQEQECVVGEIVPRSPAEKAGLRPGDVITKADDKDIDGFDDLLKFLQATKPGDKVRLTVKRTVADGQAFKEIEVTLGEYPARSDRP
jgi:putative serine protease PepD